MDNLLSAWAGPCSDVESLAVSGSGCGTLSALWESETRAVASAGDDTRFYDTAYGRFADELYASIGQEAFGGRIEA